MPPPVLGRPSSRAPTGCTGLAPTLADVGRVVFGTGLQFLPSNGDVHWSEVPSRKGTRSTEVSTWGGRPHVQEDVKGLRDSSEGPTDSTNNIDQEVSEQPRGAVVVFVGRETQGGVP